MPRTAAAYVDDEMQDHLHMQHLETIERCQRKLRKWNIRAHDHIFPMTPFTRQIFVEGTTIFAHLQPSKKSPGDYAFALSEICACYGGGLIAIGLPLSDHPSPVPDKC